MNAIDMPELRPIFDALRRGTQRSRIRLLVVVCGGPGAHRLLEVFPTASGPVALWEQHSRWEMHDGEIVEYDPPKRAWIAEAVPEQDEDGDVVGPLFTPSCRCTRQPDIDWLRIRSALDSGRRRIVASAL
ncbi:hypothetical protein RCF27_10265 [Rhodococcus pyridinivorans]|uniref:Uncharacterized protein n=1 Tax=Rhodococcus pyridinivorans TaxID=103816 RepID=A0A7M2XRZ9_9NOCA|nr:hypothetical protein [Rhodococcus pyridinivorans]QOW00625.1 hypothetical protein INP59_10070 [Rhodococcus pyridinivorans]WMM74628.1 hypothetical protein RCF27_10265 [Rhodococcus pyridinivorans]